MKAKILKSPLLIVTVIVAGLYLLFTTLAGTNVLIGGSQLSADFSQQYVSFFAYMRNSILNGQAFTGYSFGNGLGGGTAGLWGYYLLSPFNVIALFFTAHNMPVALYLIILCKVALAGLAMMLLARKRWAQMPTAIQYALAIAYSFCGYVVLYQRNLMWLDAVALLPLIIVALINLLENNRVLAYVLLLNLILIVNFYTGYMVCIFIFMFTMYFVVADFGGWWQLVRRLVTVLLASLLAVAGSAIALLPVYQNLKIGKIATSILVVGRMLKPDNWQDTIVHLVPFSTDAIAAPSIFIGQLALIGFIGYWWSRSIKWQGKLAALVVTVTLIASFFNLSFYLFWHGGSAPIGYSYRYAFVVVFWLIWLAGEALNRFDFLHTKKALFIPTALVYGGFMVAVLINRARWQISWFHLLVFVVIGVAAFLILFKGAKFGARWFTAAVLILAVAEAGINFVNTSHQVSNQPAKTYTQYNQRLSKTMGVVNKAAKPSSQNFYRMSTQKMRNSDRGEALVYGYNGVEIFGSTLSANTPKLLSLLGQRTAQYYIQYSNGTVFTDSLFGVQYYVQTAHNKQNQNDLDFGYRQETIGKKVAQVGSDVVVKNDNALPIAFTVPDKQTYITLTPNYSLINQTNILRTLAGTTTALTTRIRGRISSKHGTVANTNEVLTLQRNKKAKVETIKWTYKVQRGTKAYVSVPAALCTGVSQLWIDGHPIRVFNGNGTVLPFGITARSNKIEIKVKTQATGMKVLNLELDKINYAALKTTASRIKQGAMQVQQIEDGYLLGTVNNKAITTVATTIPSETGWHIKVDGHEVYGSSWLSGSFIAVRNLSKGKHTIEMKYITPGFRKGLMISAVAWLIMIGLVIGPRWTRILRLTHE